MAKKATTVKQFEFNDNHFTVHKGTVYLAQAEEIKKVLEHGSWDGNELKDYTQATVADIKKVATLFASLEKALAAVDKVRNQLSDIRVFNENPNIDEDGDLTVGCTYLTLDDAKGFVKKL